MTAVLIIVDTQYRFTTSHPSLVEQSHLGFLGISFEAFLAMPQEVKDSLVPIKIIHNMPLRFPGGNT